ncbi:MAG: PAS domain S-box protein [Candidatus Omnitrophota bacterium]|nr:PAS domain S-box protein [Candidatus Omnitrophota bacterium]MDZ4242983.1 PAS domain S-box protein [Candidatus Omnitrophota bacterium]
MGEMRLKNKLAVAWVALAVFLIFVVDLITPLGIIPGILYLAVVFTAVGSSNLRLPLFAACSVSAFLVAGTVISWPQNHNLVDLLLNRFFVLTAIWGALAWGAQHKRQLGMKSFLAAIVDSSDDAIIGETLDGKISTWNRGAIETFGYTAEEILGKPSGGLLPEGTGDETPQLINLLKWGRRINYYETVRRTKSGRMIDVSLTISPIKNSAGELIGISSIARDITQRKQAREAVKRERDRAQQYLDIASVLLVALNTRGEVTLINKKGLGVLGYPEEEILGKDWFGTFLPGPIQAETRKVFHQFLSGEVPHLEYYENPVVTRLGEERLIAWRNTLVRDEGGQVIGTLSSGEDITEKRRAEETRQYLASIVDSSDDAIIGVNLEGNITSWNRGAEQIYGYSAQEIIGKPAHTLSPEHKQQECHDLISRLKQGDRVKNLETVRQDKSGRQLNVSLTISPIQDCSGSVTGISVIAHDISERIRSQEDLKKLNDRLDLEKTKLEEVLSIEEGLNATLNLDRLVDFVVEKTVRVLDADRCSLMLLDDKTRELCIKGFTGLNERHILNNRLRVGESVAGQVAQQGLPVLVTDIESDERFLRKNRPSYKSKSFICAPIKLGHDIMGVLSVAEKKPNGTEFSDLDLKILCMITRQVAVALESAKLYKELKYLTITDPLTNMYNYRHFAKSLDHEIRRMKRYGGALCLLMMDVDDFKIYNDTFGHLEGDALLKQLGQILNENLRDVDIACRYAGDEFVVILPETDLSEAEVVADKLKRRVEEYAFKMKITLSIGVASFHENMDRFEFILKADTALYEAKREGKNRVCVR